MSRIEDLGDNFENLPAILDTYNNTLLDAEKNLKITGKRLEIANSENSALLYYYDQRRVELHTLSKFFMAEEKQVRSKLYKSYKEKYSRTLGTTEIEKYIDSEEAYVKIHGLLLEVDELLELYKSVVAAITSRNYTLTNITKLRIASLENVEI